MTKNLSSILDDVDRLHVVKTAEDGPKSKLACLQNLVPAKYTLIAAYMHYGDQLQSFSRDGLFKHLNEHLDEERKQLYQIHKKIVALGSSAKPRLDKIDWRDAALNDPRAVLQHLQTLEDASVSLWNALFRCASDDVALNGLAQNYAIECQGHSDDLARYLRSAP